PFLGPVRVAQIIAIVGTPFRFRGKRRFWPYVGLGVVTHSSADKEIVAGSIRRRRRPPLTRGLNRNHNRVLKDVFKGAATAAAHKDGPLKDLYEQTLAHGVDPDMALLTLARKISSVAPETVEERRVLGSSETDHASDIALVLRRTECGVTLTRL